MKQWQEMTYSEKNIALYYKQKHILDTFLERNAISIAQYNKSLHDLTEKMNIGLTA